MVVNEHPLTYTQTLFYKLDLQRDVKKNTHKYIITKFVAKNDFIYNKISFDTIIL